MRTTGGWKPKAGCVMLWALIGLSLIGFRDARPVRAEEPIRVGLSLALTGRFAVIAQDQEKGYRLWEREVNARGGILGRPVQLIVYDDGSQPQRGAELYLQLITTDRVDFLFGPYSSMISHAVLPVAARYNVPILIGGAAADSLWEKGYTNVVGIYTPASKFTLGFFELLVWEAVERVSLINADDSFSSDVVRSAERWAGRFGLQIVHRATFSKDATKLDTLAAEARDRNSQAVILGGHLNEAVDLRAAFKRIAWYPQAFYASVGPTLPAFLARCGPDAESVFGTSLWEPRANFPGSRHFHETFKETFALMPSYHAALAYATGQVLEAAIVRAGNADRAAVRDSLFQMDTMTIIGRYGVDGNGKQVRQHTFITQWQNGTKEIVWPPEIQTAPPVFNRGAR